MEAHCNLWRHGVHDIAHQCDRRRDGDGLVYEGKVVPYRVLARRLSRLVHAQNVVAPLGERQEKREQEGHQHKPLARHDVGGISSGKHSQHEAEGHNAHVDDGILFQLCAIAKVHDVVEQQHAAHPEHMCGVAQQGGDGACQQQRQRHERTRRAHGHGSRGQRTAALDGVAAVGLNVVDVVEAVHRRGHEAVRDERKHRGAYV